MAHFYGTLDGTRGQATRCGTKISGLTTRAASWDGSIVTEIWYDRELGCNRFKVSQTPWNGNGINETLTAGIIGKPATAPRSEMKWFTQL